MALSNHTPTMQSITNECTFRFRDNIRIWHITNIRNKFVVWNTFINMSIRPKPFNHLIL